jgi:hypothetical protein
MMGAPPNMDGVAPAASNGPPLPSIEEPVATQAFPGGRDGPPPAHAEEIDRLVAVHLESRHEHRATFKKNIADKVNYHNSFFGRCENGTREAVWGVVGLLNFLRCGGGCAHNCGRGMDGDEFVDFHDPPPPASEEETLTFGGPKAPAASKLK